MFRLDYLSCLLTVLATILLGRKSWTGLLVAIVNSLIVCVIGLRTSQLGFIPANLFCICIYVFSIRSWFRERTNTNRHQAEQQVFAAPTLLNVESINASTAVGRRTDALTAQLKRELEEYARTLPEVPT
jgi:hypothetical protein